MTQIGIKHQRITPLWPQANSEAENFMKPLTKTIRAARTENKDWKKELYTFLLNYRATPHKTTGFPPSELLFNRLIRTKLPQIVTVYDRKKDEIVRQKDEQAKTKMKQYADKKRRAKNSEIRAGDTVLLRQKKHSKFSTKFDPRPFKVTRIKGTMITAVRNGKYVTRNASLFKPVNVQVSQSDEEEETDDDDDQPLIENQSRNSDYPHDTEESENSDTRRRYPQRNRRPLERYGQNVYDN